MQITLDRYGHLFPSVEAALADAASPAKLRLGRRCQFVFRARG